MTKQPANVGRFHIPKFDELSGASLDAGLFDARQTLPILTKAIIGLLVLLLAYNFYQWAQLTLFAIFYPGQLDFGEGVVWQQALMMARGDGYAPIEAEPHIVFHYPPVYHFLIISVSDLFGVSYLVAGRMISAASTIVIACVVAAFYAHAYPGLKRSNAFRLSILVIFLCVFTLHPITRWSYLMRVDMIAAALGVTGAFLAFRFPDRRRAVVVSALICVAAVYAKQTNIAAVGAAFILLLVMRPAHAALWAATSIASGLAVLAFMILHTDGEFLRHIVLYNINRFDAFRLIIIPVLTVLYFFYSAAIFVCLRELLKFDTPGATLSDTFQAFRKKISADSLARLRFFWGLFTVLAILPALAYAKIGAGVNYFIDLSIAGVIAVGLLLPGFLKRFEAASANQENGGTLERVKCALLPAALIVQLFLAPSIKNFDELRTAEAGAEGEKLNCRVVQAEKPIISDNMVSLLINGKEVFWESAIFAELSAKGLWDDAYFAERIGSGDFAFIMTMGGRGDGAFDERYSNRIADAIDSAYPEKETSGEFVYHLPHRNYAQDCG